jgi:cell division septum initiation protein DivIVA
MTEIEQLRAEIAELREKLAQLEARKGRIEDAGWREHQRARMQWLQANPMPQPRLVQDIAHLFPSGTVLC